MESMFAKVVLVRDAHMVDSHGQVIWEGRALRAQMTCAHIGDPEPRDVVVQVPVWGWEPSGYGWDELSPELKSLYGPIRRAGVSKALVQRCASLLIDEREAMARREQAAIAA
jgi:hypothetical protein